MKLYLVHCGAPLALQKGLSDPQRKPGLLVSYAYLKLFQRNRSKLHFREWVMDSGAFTAHNSGKPVQLQHYLATCQTLLQQDKLLKAVFSLDVIGDWKASAKNTAFLWREGVQAIPCFHINEPEQALLEMADTYPRIAVGGMVGLGRKAKEKWLGQVFARVWPKKIHGFGLGSENMLLKFPFDSVDNSTWEIQPLRFGTWPETFPGLRLRGGKQNLRAQVERYMNLERKATQRWAREGKTLAKL